MKFKGVTTFDEKSKKFFVFIQKFPGICAQGNSFEEAHDKVNKYFKAYVERMRSAEVTMDEREVQSI